MKIMMTSRKGYCFLLPAVICILTATAFAGRCPSADLNGNCLVNIYDLEIFADQWLDAESCEETTTCADFDGLNGIDFADFSILAGQWQTHGSMLFINEFMASNNSSSGYHDPNGNYDDWIEIYNLGDTSVNMAGMYLTDNLANTTKFHIPAGYSSQTTIPARGFLVFWADDETIQGPLHTNFKLSADGEEIGLYDTDGVTQIDAVAFLEQTANVSYGRYPDAEENWRFFSTATPGASNSNAYLGDIDNVDFSKERGFYDSNFMLTLACTTSGANIYYTTDGRDPIAGEVNTPTSVRYTSPIFISATKCIRAAAIKTSYKPSPIETHTYIFGASAAAKAMPLVSLVGDPNKTFYEPNGIMAIVGGYYNSDGVWTSGGTGTYNNMIMQGSAYERPVSLEMIDPQTSSNIQVKCGIFFFFFWYTREIYTRGNDLNTCWINWWPNWNTNKISFNLFFDSDYGSSRLEYPFFPFIDVARFKSICLRAGHNDSCTPFIKDEWMRRLFQEMGGTQETGTYANLYINGDFKAYYNPTGRADNGFYQEWYGTDNDFDIITQGGLRNGDLTALNNLINYVNTHNLSNTTYYNYVAGQFDITQFVDYLILQIYSSNFDWPGNNYTIHRERSSTGKFRFSVWDAEGIETWVAENHMDVNAFEDLPSWTSPTGLNHLQWDYISQFYRALKANPDFQLLFADRIHKYFRNSGILTKPHLLAKWWEVFSEVSPVLPYIDYPASFIPNTFIPNREDPILGVFEQQGLFTRAFGAPVFNVNGSYKFGGYVSSTDSFTLTDPCSSGGTIYYTIDGNDPRTPFTGTISSSAIQYTGTFTLNKSTDLKSRIYKSSTQKWSPLNEAIYEVGNLKNSLRITEIMYNPLDTSDPNDPNKEYIELKNVGSGTINLNLVRFDKGVDFIFGPNTLTTGQHILVVKDISAFTTKYGTGRYIAGHYAGSLDNGGERLRLLDAVGGTILDFNYSDGWRDITDGDGYSLTIVNPSDSDTNDWGKKDSWRASAYINGSPGWDDSNIIPNPGAIVINEVLAHSHDITSDWIELKNTTTNAINIGNWYLSDSDSNIMKYRFATGTSIPANGYLVVYEGSNFGSTSSDPGRLIPFALSENGESVCLTSALDANSKLTGYREKEDFGASDTNVAFGRYYKGSTKTYNFVPMSTNTPGAANSYPKVGPIIFSEIMYHPDWPASGSYSNNEYEYIELLNASSSAVTLYDSNVSTPWKFTNGIDYTFPTSPSTVTIAAGSKILVVKNVAAFEARYPSVPTGIIYGPYSGKLANEGEQLELSKPGDVNDMGIRQYIRVERVDYSDGSHPSGEPCDVDLWPTGANGSGKSLIRTNTTQYGNDPNNWTAATPTPGS